ncbi:MAG: ABC transporter ATP-binding protein [Candidatus Sumerlaeaceae bacterium]|nr:ABC transporter ATP-binding protein [Candidatus Sumerlaeaceae bacterium]
MLLELDSLDAGYGRKVVLSGVTLNYAGGAVGLLGPNGAGKSTLLKTILGFLPPLSGTLRVFGKPMPQAAREVRGRIGYMPETEALIPGLNAVNFVAFMAELSGLPRAAAVERAHEVLQYVGLGEARYRNVETYSTGMKQRVKLAQAIVHDPTLLLLDEPTNGMDPHGRNEMIELVNDLAHNKGMSVILCSHLLPDVEQVAEEIIVLGNGRVAARKFADKGKEAAETVFTVRVRGNPTEFLRLLNARGLRAVESEGAPGLLVALPHGTGTDTVFRCAAEAGCLVMRLEPRTERLEDLFEQALGELGHAHL